MRDLYYTLILNQKGGNVKSKESEEKIPDSFLTFFPKRRALDNSMLFAFYLVDIRQGAGFASVFGITTPPVFVFSRFFRTYQPILCAVFLLVSGGGTVVFAQFDARNQQNRNIPEARLPQSAQSQSTNSAAVQREMQVALQKLPWSELTPAAQAKIRSIASNSPLFHRMPQQTVYSDPEIHQFLLRHPDMVIGFWEQLGATQLSLREVRENQYVLRETGGTVATVEVLYRTDSLCIAFAKGEYRGPLLAKAYQGDVLLVLRTHFKRDEMGEPIVVCDLDTFIQINSVGADMLVKLFFSQLSKIAESNFEFAISFVGQVSRAAARTPNAVKDTAEDITSVRQEVCADFCDVVDRVTMRYAKRNQPASLPTAQQRTQPVASQPRIGLQDFTMSTKPPTDWGLDHFFDGPKSDVPLPGELAVPRVIDSGGTPPRLPRSGW